MDLIIRDFKIAIEYVLLNSQQDPNFEEHFNQLIPSNCK
jgi:hypothetical protein